MLKKVAAYLEDEFPWRDVRWYLFVILVCVGFALVIPHGEEQSANAQTNQNPAEIPLEGIATAIIAVFAVAQYFEFRRSSERQLRAYISATASKAALLTDNKTIVVIIELRNTGQTPAFNFQQKGNIIVLSYPLDYHIPLNPLEQDIPTPTYVFYPGAQHGGAPRHVLTWDEGIKLMTGNGHALYVFGKMSYVDAFKRKQWAEFCAILEGLDFWDWVRRAKDDPDRQPVSANFRFTKGNNRASSQ